MANGFLGRSLDLAAAVVGKRTLRSLRISLPALLVGLLALPSLASAVNLPDGRVYEEVTPVHMNGNRADPEIVSASGESVQYKSTGAFAGEASGNGYAAYDAVRTPSGWATYNALPSSAKYFTEQVFSPFYGDISSDLTKAVTILNKNPFESNATIYAVGDYYLLESEGTGGLTPTRAVDLTPQTGLDAGERAYAARGGLRGESADFTHAYYNALSSNLLEEVELGTPSQHYREMAVVGPNNPDGTGTPIGECGARFGGEMDANANSGSGSTTLHAISPTGSIVVLTVEGCVFSIKGPLQSEVVARVNGAETIPISEPSLEYCPGFGGAYNLNCKAAIFQGASTDDSKIFFTSTQAEEAPGVTDTTNNIYEAELTGASSKSVTRRIQISAGDTSGEGARVQGVVRISDDGSHVYFVAQGVLTDALGPEGTAAQNGADNLYVYDDGTTKFIGELCSGLRLSGNVVDAQCPSNAVDGSLWAKEDEHPAWAAPYGFPSANGHSLVFNTYAQLIAQGPEADTDIARDIYEYDTQANTLVRISTGRNDFDDNGNDSRFNAILTTPQWALTGLFAPAAADEHAAAGGGEGGRPVSNDGSFIFFETSEALEPDDVNGAPDVYEWHDGLVSLISDGQDLGTNLTTGLGGNANYFLGASVSGRDVFIQTPDTLVSEGGESPAAIYDARIGGGFPKAIVPPPCREDACQGNLSPSPSFPSPSSALYASGENATPSTVVTSGKNAGKLKKSVKRTKPQSKKKHKKKPRVVKKSSGKAGK